MSSSRTHSAQRGGPVAAGTVARQLGFARFHTSPPDFVAITGRELAALDLLEPWIRTLFLALVRLTNFSTGRGTASWAQLVEALDWRKPSRGRRAAPELSADQIRRGFAKLVGAGLVRRNAVRNEKEGCLFFSLAARTGLGSSDKSARVSAGEKRGAARGEKQGAAQQISRDFRQDTQENTNTPHAKAGAAQEAPAAPPRPQAAPPQAPQLPGLGAGIGAMVAAVRAHFHRPGGGSAARGNNRPPQGGQTMGSSSHAPQGLRPSVSAQADPSPAGRGAGGGVSVGAALGAGLAGLLKGEVRPG